METGERVLRAMQPDDVDKVLDAQEPASVAGLAAVFPQDLYPFPRAAIAERWRTELADANIDCFVIRRGPAVAGFAAIKGDEVLHFGVALEAWGSGVAVAAHAELVELMWQAGAVQPWLRVYSGNARGRAFWEKVGWHATGERSRGGFPPHAELLTYELRPPIDRNQA